jgi:predicted homoserine dehydrogenase-like protein
MQPKYRIGVVGSGKLAKGFIMAVEDRQDLSVSRVLTRSDIGQRSDFPQPDLLTNSINELIRNSELVVECSGDAIYATDVIEQVMSASLPVVTMDSELQVTTGSYFSGRGFITEAEGDQPGCLAALKEDTVQMGFKPLVYGNIKGFLNHNPTRDEMEYWGKKLNLSLNMVTSFTDGTKVHIEQALVANGLGADIASPGLLGIASEDVNSGATALVQHAETLGCPVSDYILSPKSPPGVFIVARHDKRQQAYLSRYKMGGGPYYILLKNYHLCHLEIAKTIIRVLGGGGVLLNNSNKPRIGVAAVAKKPLAAGHIIKRGIGSFDVRGIAVRLADNPDHIPIGLLDNAVLTRDIEAGHQLSFDDVEIPDSLALCAWRQIAETSQGILQ